MNSITVEGVQLHYVPSIPAKFDCQQCALRTSDKRCVRMYRDETLYFEESVNADGKLFCINHGRDVVFINDTPEDIARYVAARLENT